MTPTDQLIAARAVIEAQTGLAYGVYYSMADGCHCTLGALLRVGGYFDPDKPNERTALTILREQKEAMVRLASVIDPAEMTDATPEHLYDLSFHIIAKFNDRYTREAVLAVFDAAIAP